MKQLPSFGTDSTSALPHRIGGNQKHSKQSTNADQKLPEIVFSIAFWHRFHVCFTTPDRWQSKTLLTIKLRSKIARNSVFDCHLLPAGQQMAIKNSISNYF